MQKKKEVAIIIGAGPAGLATGYALSKEKVKVTIFEKSVYIGGISKTINYKGYLFDHGPHRFFTKNKDVDYLWHKLLGKDFLKIPRLTRIFYKNKYFAYPVKPFDVFFKLGFFVSLSVTVSYIKAAIYLKKTLPKNFEDWVTKNFGHKLFKIFFKTYTEKVWGIDCNKIGAEWAGQRIKNLSIPSIVKNILNVKKGGNKIKSLIDEFEYPRKGAGMMYEKLASELKKNGGELILNNEVISINHADDKIISVITCSNGIKKGWSLDHLVSSMPLTDLIEKLSPPPPQRDCGSI